MADSTGDDALYARASRGDEDAVAALIKATLPRLVTYVRLRAGGRLQEKESISDLVQSACREVFADARARAMDTEELKRWLFRAAEHKVIDKARYWAAAKRDPRREVPLHGDPSGAGEALCREGCAANERPSQIAMGREQLERLEAAFARLPEHYREVILLARVVRLKHAEIARILDRSEEATRKLLVRALAELTRLL